MDLTNTLTIDPQLFAHRRMNSKGWEPLVKGILSLLLP